MRENEKNLYSLQRNTGLIGRYVIQEVLGQGGFGITYLGIDKLYGNKVAIKEYYPQEIAMRKAQYEDVVTVTSIEEKNNYDKGKKRFLDEAQVMARFNKNEGIVKILDFFEANNTAYIVMEYLEGITLKQYLGKYGVIQFRNLIEMMRPLLEALIEIHSQGLIHRDISPDNIMVQHNGKVKLMDFGAARDYTESGNKSLSVILKPGYAPPEQYQTHGVQGPWTDIYALCATIYKCLTGITPPDAIARVMDDKFKEPDQLDGKLSPDIKKILWKGMNIFPEERYQDIGEFGEDVYDALFMPEENKKLDLDNKKNIDEDLDSPDKDNESVLKDDKIEGAVKKTSIPKKEKRKSPVKELKKYIFFSSIGVFLKEIGALILSIILLIVVVTDISDILDMLRNEGSMLGKILICVVVLLPVFGIAQYCFNVLAPKRIIRRLEGEGELSNVIMDFQKGEKLFGDAVRVGNKYIIGKGTKDIVAYKDIKQIYQYIHKTNHFEDYRTLRAYTDIETIDICQLPRNGAGEQTVRQLIMYICAKNPNIKVGYR